MDLASVSEMPTTSCSGRPLGRAFKVKLWHTLVFLRDGREVARLVRPGDVSAIRAALAQIGAAGGP